MSTEKPNGQTETQNPVGSSEIVRCADYQAGTIRCPVMDCNEGSGRMLFQLLPPLDNLEHRLEDYLSDLPPSERLKKREHFRSLRHLASL